MSPFPAQGKGLSTEVNTKDLALATTWVLPLYHKPVLQVISHFQRKGPCYCTKTRRWYLLQAAQSDRPITLILQKASQSLGDKRIFLKRLWLSSRPCVIPCCITTLLYLLSTTDPHSVVSAPLTSTCSARINLLTSKIQHCHITAGLQDKEQQVMMTEASFKCSVPTHRNCKYTKCEGRARGLF